MTKKNPIQSATIVLALAAGLGALSYFVIKPRQDASDKNKDKASLLFLGLEKGQIDEFVFQNPNGAFDIKRKADNREHWFVTAGEKVYEADKNSIDGLLSTILAAKKESAVTTTSDLKSLGLEPAKYKLSVTSGATPVKRELWVGEDTPVDYLVYAKWSDNPEIFLTTRSLRFSIDKKIDEIRNKKAIEVKLAELAKWELKTAGFDKIAPQNLLFEKDDKGDWRHTRNPQVKVATPEVERFFKNLNGLTAIGFASEVPTERKAKFGFWAPKATLTLTPADTKQPPQVWILSSAMDRETKKERFYFARMDKDSTFEVAETFRDNFRVDLFHFREKQLHPIKKDDIGIFTLQDGLQSVEFTKRDGNWEVRGKVLKGEVQGRAKREYTERALDQLANLKPVEFLDGRTPYTLGLQKPTRIVEFRSAKGDPISTLFFGRKLGEDKIVMRTEGMDAAAAVVFKVDEVLSLNPEAFLDATAAPPAVGSDKPAPASASIKKGVKVELEKTLGSPKEIKKLPAPIVKAAHKYSAEITFQNGKKIVLALDAEKAPYTVSNFLHLARNHYYDGVKFHRVIPDFMAQGGDPTGTGGGGPGYKFDNEDNDLQHKPGAISMAHAGPGTNGSQFFLVFKRESTAHLDGKHTVFGYISEGMDVLNGIQQGDTMKTVRVFEEAL